MKSATKARMKAFKLLAPDAMWAPPVEVVMTTPAELREKVGDGVVHRKTYDAIATLFSRSKEFLRVMAPSMDPSFTALLALVNAPVIQVVTAAQGPRSNKPDPIIERCLAFRKIDIRYLCERKALFYMMNAKLIIRDGVEAYVGSANITDQSLHYNFELGTIVRDRAAVIQLERVFDFAFITGTKARNL